MSEYLEINVYSKVSTFTRRDQERYDIPTIWKREMIRLK